MSPPQIRRGRGAGRVGGHREVSTNPFAKLGKTTPSTQAIYVGSHVIIVENKLMSQLCSLPTCHACKRRKLSFLPVNHT